MLMHVEKGQRLILLPISGINARRDHCGCCTVIYPYCTTAKPGLCFGNACYMQQQDCGHASVS